MYKLRLQWLKYYNIVVRRILSRVCCALVGPILPTAYITFLTDRFFSFWYNIAPVALRWIVGAVMYCHVAATLTDCQGMFIHQRLNRNPPSVPIWEQIFTNFYRNVVWNRKKRIAWVCRGKIEVYWGKKISKIFIPTWVKLTPQTAFFQFFRGFYKSRD